MVGRRSPCHDVAAGTHLLDERGGSMMGGYVVRRLIMIVPTIIIVAFLSFMLMRLVPGDVILAQVSAGGATGGPTEIDQERINQIKKELGLEGSVPEQFLRWAGGVLRGDFGESWLTHQDTLAQFGQRARVSIQLGIMAIVLSVLIGVPIGVISALWQDSAPDYIGRLIAVLGLSIPNFFLGVLMILLFSRVFNYTFPTGVNEFWDDPWLNLQQFLIPAFVLAFASAGVTMRLTRTSLLEVLRQDYIRTAHAKGLSGRLVIIRHALRNAMIPVTTVVGTQLAFIIGGSVVVEQLFNLRGVGSLTLTSVLQRDYVQLQTNVFLFSLVLVFGNLITDLSYGFLDPRIRYG
jgi:peptide/nickel transport system permease protein